MAGEIEEPFRLNFQADLLHSGSISFGRYESEPLSWERRSIFSHNRYLEEVEKYSKPGSVTEKKAYFEAHFRRKALQKQNSSESQDGGEFPTSRNNDRADLEDSSNGDENGKFTYLGENPSSSDPFQYNRKPKIQQHEEGTIQALYADNGNASRHVACFDESPHNSGYDDDTVSQKCDGQHCKFLPDATPKECGINMVDCAVSVPDHVKLDDIHRSEIGNAVGYTEENIGATLIEKVVSVASKTNDSSLTCQTLEKDGDGTSFGPHRKSSCKVKPASEKKLTRETLKTQANVDRFRKHVSDETSKGSMKPRTHEGKGLPVKKTEKKSPRPASPFTCSGVKTSKAEDAITSLREKEFRMKKSIMKDLGSEKAAKVQSLLTEKSHPGLRPTLNRPKQTVSSSNSHIIQSAASYSFKTGQRAENRKEEKLAAEMKQFRRSLNFKATPLPSFYNESTRASDQSKVTPISKTPSQPRPSSQSAANRGDKKSCFASDMRPRSSTSTNRIRVPETVGSKKKEPQEKKKESSYKDPEARARDIERKGGRGPRSGYLAVGIAAS